MTAIPVPGASGGIALDSAHRLAYVSGLTNSRWQPSKNNLPGARGNVINVYVKTDPKAHYRQGMSLFLDTGHTVHIPTVAREVFDVSGEKISAPLHTSILVKLGDEVLLTRIGRREFAGAPDQPEEIEVLAPLHGKVELRPGEFSDEMRQMVELRDRIDREIHAVTGIRMTVELVAPNALERSAGKARRVLDHRSPPRP